MTKVNSTESTPGSADLLFLNMKRYSMTDLPPDEYTRLTSVVWAGMSTDSNFAITFYFV